jgi:hypothetical protein
MARFWIATNSSTRLMKGAPDADKQVLRADDGFREYLPFQSSAEFCSRNIFAGERPLRRARTAWADSQMRAAKE